MASFTPKLCNSTEIRKDDNSIKSHFDEETTDDSMHNSTQGIVLRIEKSVTDRRRATLCLDEPLQRQRVPRRPHDNVRRR